MELWRPAARVASSADTHGDEKPVGNMKAVAISERGVSPLHEYREERVGKRSSVQRKGEIFAGPWRSGRRPRDWVDSLSWCADSISNADT